MMFGQLQSTEETAAKKMAQTLIQRYSERVRARIEQGKAIGEITSEVDTHAAATLFIGTVQGLVMQSMLSGDLLRMRTEALGVYAIYERGMRNVL
jgi:hypothetical protein